MKIKKVIASSCAGSCHLVVSSVLLLILQAGSTLPLVAQGAGLTFDGNNDYVAFGPAPGLGASAFTIETWFKRTGAGTTANTGTSGLNAVPLVTKGRGEADGSNVDMNWFLGLSGDKLAADFEDTATGLNHPVTGGTSVSLNVWHHAAATYDGTTWRLYLDGVLDAQSTAGATPRYDSIQHAALGSALTSTAAAQGAFAGVLKQARVWNYARTQAQIAEGMSGVYPSGTSGLSGQWALNETSGTMANDSSGHNISGTLINGPVWGDIAPTTVKIIKGPWLQNVTPQSVVVMWETQIAANTRVDYGLTDSLGGYVEDAAQRTIHEITLPNLSADTWYSYRVSSGDVVSAINSFITAPSDTAVPFRFVAHGDTRTYPDVHAAVVRSILRSAPDFVLHVGDYVANGMIYSEWEPQYFTPAADMLKLAPLFTVMGNHEFSGTGKIWYYDFFSVPDNGLSGYGEHFYAFTYGCARFIGLSACEGGCDSFSAGTPQYNWLLNQFTSPEFENAKWRFVWMHNPPFTSVQQDNPVDQQLRTVLVPLFEQYGVDVVFSGDDHFYRHTLKNGIHYIVTGGGGAPLHAVGSPMPDAPPLYAESANEHCVIDVTPGTFQFRAVRTNDTIMDSFTLTKDITPPLIMGVAATEITGNTAKITWTTDEIADSAVNYGTSTAYGSTAVDSTMATSHSVALTNLQAETTYYFEVTSTDYAGNSSSQGGLSFITAAGNHAPTAKDQSVSTAEDTALALTLTGSDVDGDTVSFAAVTGPLHGTVSGTAPNLSYTPAPNYNGTDSFTFKANDGELDSAPATVFITITPENDPPVAQNQTLTTTTDMPLTVTLMATDVDGDAITYQVVTAPAHGTLTGSAPDLIYTPEPTYKGTDSFTFKANDSQLDSAPAAVSIVITAVNHAPMANSQSVTTPEDNQTSIELAGSDPDRDMLTFEVVTAPAHGTLSGKAPNLTYTPAPDYNGPDTFTFMVNDGRLDSPPATVSITVTPVNDPPVAQGQTLTTTTGTPLDITLTATDVDGDALTYQVVSAPSNGSLGGTAPNLTYTPEAGYAGSDSFTFQASDGQGDGGTATVQITVNAVRPEAPGNLTATAVSRSQIDLNWIDNSDNEVGFEIQRSTDNIRFTVDGSLAAGVTVYSSQGLLANKQYYFRVRAFNTSGPSEFSNTVKVRTLKK